MTKDTPGALTKPVSGILCKNYLSRVLLPSRTHSKYLLWGNCEILTKWTLRENFSFRTPPAPLPSSESRGCRRGLGGFSLKYTLAQSVERTIAVKAKPVAIENSALFASKARIPFCLKHAHFGAHPEYVMQKQIRIHLNGGQSWSQKGRAWGPGGRFYLRPPECEGGAVLDWGGGSQRQGYLTHPGQSPSKSCALQRRYS